ncbi:MAG: fibronectin type III domain-containing protein, partial [Spartobacteria bacterium]
MSRFLLNSFLVAAFSCFATGAFADNLTLSWDPNNEGNIQGYKLYWGTASGGPYNRVDDTHHQTTTTLTTLTNGVRYYFVVTAYNTEDVESAYSAEISAVAGQTPTPTPSPTPTATPTATPTPTPTATPTA